MSTTFDPEKIKRFWSLVDMSGGFQACWLWMGHKNVGGYGMARIAHRERAAHRISWMLANNQTIPDRMCICHHCDNPACVNPSHLWLGTYLDNMQDRERKGRAKRGEAKHKDSKASCSPMPQMMCLQKLCVERSARHPKKGKPHEPA